MIHVVFQKADVEILNKAIELDASLQGDVFEIKDDFAIGPLHEINSDEGWNNRLEWWKNLITLSPYSNELAGSFDDRKTVEELKHRLDAANEELWIWMGQNAHDVCGYYWLVSQLSDYGGKILVLYLNNLPFINEKGQLFYPVSLHEIQPKEFLKAKKLNRKITPGEFEVDSDEWKKLVEEDAIVRWLEGGKKISSKPEDTFDKDILAGLTAEWQKGHRAMQSILSKMKVKTGDIFLLWRILKLVEQDVIELTGDPANGWKEFEIKIKSKATEMAETNNA